MFIDKTYLFYISEVDRIVAQNYAENGSITFLEVWGDDDYGYQVEASLKVGYNYYHPSFFITPDQRIVDAECDCHWFKPDKLCAHIGACIYHLIGRFIDEDGYYYDAKEESEKSIRDIRNSKLSYFEKMNIERGKLRTQSLLIHNNSKRSKLIKKVFQDDTYYLVPSFEKDGRLYLSFNIYNKENDHYVIKNWYKLLDAIDDHDDVRYGKKIAFIHDIDAFSERSKRFITFLRQVKGNAVDNYGYDSYHRPRHRYVYLEGDDMDAFYHIFKDDETIFKKTDDIVEVTLSDEGYYYSLSIEDDDMIFTKFGIYRYRDDIIEYFAKADEIICEFLYQVNADKLIVADDDLDDVLNTFIYPYQNIIKLKTNVALKKRDDIQSLSLYGDLYDDNILIDIYGLDEKGEKIAIIDNDKYDHDFKVQVLKTVLNNYGHIEDGHYLLDLEDEKTLDFVQNSLSKLNKYCDVYISEAIKKLAKKARYKIQAGVRFNNGLLEIDISSDDLNIDEASKILSAYRQKKKYYRLKDGSTIKLESEELKELDDLFRSVDLDLKVLKNGKATIDAYRAFGLDSKLDKMTKLTVDKDPTLLSYINGLKDLRSDHEMLERYDDILRDYQKYGVKWLLMLYDYNLNGILADEMGLGKTIQVIALLDTIKDEKKHSIIVCPASLIYNWEDEINRFSAGLKYELITGTKKAREEAIKRYEEYDVIITSYDYLRRDIEVYKDHDFEYIILDEAQNIKNQKTKNATSVKELKSRHRLALSGTPIENSLAELWSIFDFLMPHYLFSYNYFKTNFETGIVLYDDDEKRDELKTLVSPFILRRTKKDVLKELPDKVDHEYLIDFNEDEHKLYLANLATVNKEMKIKMNGPEIDHIAILAMLTRLRELCLDPRLIYDDIKEPSSKVLACIDLVKILHEHDKKVLIFSSFTSLIDLLALELDKEDIKYYTLTGKTSKEERRDLVAKFQSDKTPVFLISLKAGGTGLNLTAAEAVIHIDPWWNISAQEQATDRAHRIGQNANVQVYRLIMRDSIEEKIVKMQRRKKDLADAFVEGNDGSLAKMSKEDIIKLFER